MIGRGVLIIGAGPGGVSAAIWAKRLGLEPVVVEQGSRAGGQVLDLSNPVHDYLGIPVAKGSELQPAFDAHLKRANIAVQFGHKAVISNFRDLQVTVGHMQLRPDNIIIATGARRASLGVPGENELTGKGVSNSASRDKALFEGRPAAVIGGGDAAAENAVILSQICPKVYVIVRGSRLSARKAFRDAMKQSPNIEVLYEHQVLKFEGTDKLEGLRLTGERSFLALEAACVRIGVSPNVAFLGGKLDRVHGGYLRVDSEQRTSMPRIFAVGDVCNPDNSSIVCSVAHGMVAAKSISRDWEAQWL